MFKKKNAAENPTKMPGTKLMNISAIIVAVLGLASLINNIILFKDTVSQYVAQGYPSAEVLKYMVPSQLLPGLFEILAVYGGITMILIAAGIINQNLASSHELSNTAAPDVVEATESTEDQYDLVTENEDLQTE